MIWIVLSAGIDPETCAPLSCRQAEFECINSKKKQKKKGYKNSGVVSVKLCQVLYLFFVCFWYIESVYWCG